jgi:hypothetical protein
MNDDEAGRDLLFPDDELDAAVETVMLRAAMYLEQLEQLEQEEQEEEEASHSLVSALKRVGGSQIGSCNNMDLSSGVVSSTFTCHLSIVFNAFAKQNCVCRERRGSNSCWLGGIVLPPFGCKKELLWLLLAFCWRQQQVGRLAATFSILPPFLFKKCQ